MGLTTEYVTTEVGKIQVRRGGGGRPLLYLHSATGEGEGLAVLDELAGDFQVVAPMFPGYGESEGIDDIDDMEDAVFHLLDAFSVLGLEDPSIVGLSLGGWMAMELATRYPDRVSALVLVNPVGIHLQGNPIRDIFGRTPAELADDLLADQQHPLAQMMRAIGEFRSDPTQSGALTFELIRPLAQTMAATAKLGWDPYLHNPKLRRRLGRITAPTLVVRGARDTLVPEEYAQVFAAEIPAARLEVVEGAAHLLPLEKPAELAALVREFLA